MRRIGKERVGNDDRPTLDGVLDHYGVRYSPHRLSQMVQCPLHEDGKPSCSVNIDRGVWKCHSCGEGGDAITLIQLKEEIGFVGACEFVAAQSIPTGGARGSGGDVRAGRYGRRPVAQRKRGGHGDGVYVPSWRRR